jgi:cobalamin biosynthesis protein CobW
VGNRLQHYYDRDWTPEETRISKLVIIGEHDMDQAAVTQAILN